MNKKCTKCGEEKMLTEFGIQKRSTDGYNPRCKLCVRAVEKKWEENNKEKILASKTRYREKNRERIREQDREYYIENHDLRLETARKAQMKYYKTDNGREKYKAQDKKVRERNPEQARARALVYNAMRRGDLIKPTSCSLCRSDQFSIEAHHPDYSKPLEVIWVCRPCHGMIHRKIKSDRERLSEKTSFDERMELYPTYVVVTESNKDAIVCSSEETVREGTEEFPPLLLERKWISKEEALKFLPE